MYSTRCRRTQSSIGSPASKYAHVLLLRDAKFDSHAYVEVTSRSTPCKPNVDQYSCNYTARYKEEKAAQKRRNQMSKAMGEKPPVKARSRSPRIRPGVIVLNSFDDGGHRSYEAQYIGQKTKPEATPDFRQGAVSKVVGTVGKSSWCCAAKEKVQKAIWSVGEYAEIVFQ